LKIQLKWLERESPDDVPPFFVDLDTHVDIYKPDNTIIPVHIFNLDEISRKEGFQVIDEEFGDGLGMDDEAQANYSEIIIYDDFDFKNKLMIYLYAYLGDFSEVTGHAHFYHRDHGHVGFIKTPEVKGYTTWKICEVNEKA